VHELFRATPKRISSDVLANGKSITEKDEGDKLLSVGDAAHPMMPTWVDARRPKMTSALKNCHS
jgi:hypothetical protein